MDAGPDAIRDAGRDAAAVADAAVRADGGPVPGCGPRVFGSVGGHCRGGTCPTGFRCQNEIRPMAWGDPFTIRNGLGIEQGASLDPETGFYEPVPTAMVVPADDVPIPIASGTLCTKDCDVAAAMDACGSCATCATDIGMAGILETQLLYPTEARSFGSNTGWCRADCIFDPATVGSGCPGSTSPAASGAHTCSPASGVCVEGCISDNECRFSFEETREGVVVTVIDRASTATCSTVTHRCEWEHPTGTQSVGDPCTRASDCSADVGTCLEGGTCAEYECGRAADTDMTTFVCDGGRGVCLGNGGNDATICVAGCNAPADCNPGSTCVYFDGFEPPATFVGYCLGICDSRLDDPDGVSGPLTTFDDQLIACQLGEQCDDPAPTADEPDPTGSCRVPCTVDSDCTDRTPDDGDYCELIAGTSPAYGFCRWRDQVCDWLDLSADCFGGQVCDLLAWPADLGLCVEPCTDVAGSRPCTGGQECVTTGGRNVCRSRCTTGGPACARGQSCEGAPPEQFCEQTTIL